MHKLFRLFSMHNYSMTQDYAAVISAALAALFLVGFAEFIGGLRVISEDADQIRALHAEEIKESVTAFKAGRKISGPQREQLDRKLLLYQRRLNKMQILHRVSRLITLLTLAYLGYALLDVLHWSALAKPGPRPDIARGSFLTTAFSTWLLIIAHALRMHVRHQFRSWERWVEIAKQWGIDDPDEAMRTAKEWAASRTRGDAA
ncbi:hypothetical protein [Streptomyces sp. NPDC055105]|uniref:hypothetical protein n=1 Tax=Streptomyces sp. NPDC055105 TaxID=3365719 RepID=UPI0037CCFBF5